MLLQEIVPSYQLYVSAQKSSAGAAPVWALMTEVFGYLWRTGIHAKHQMCTNIEVWQLGSECGMRMAPLPQL